MMETRNGSEIRLTGFLNHAIEPRTASFSERSRGANVYLLPPRECLHSGVGRQPGLFLLKLKIQDAIMQVRCVLPDIHAH